MRRKRIAIINPPSPFLIDEKVFPNIGAVRVATALNEEHEVTLFDFNGMKSPNRVMKQVATDFDYYLFSSTTPNFPATYNLFSALKEENPIAKTVIGGPHASAMSSLRRKGKPDINYEALEEFDTIFEGEGEDTRNILKLGWQKGEIIKNLDDVPIPDSTFINLPSYKYNLFGKATTNIQTQRGCPYQCDFCSGRDIEMYNKVRNHSPERVVKEMDILNNKYGFDSFMWYDDEINLKPNRLEKLCTSLMERDYQHRGFVRSDLIVKHPHLVHLMQEAGFVKLCAGVESGSNKMLEMVNKKSDYDTNMKARKIIGDEGIHYEAFTRCRTNKNLVTNS